jgi:hypothetical protein
MLIFFKLIFISIYKYLLDLKHIYYLIQNQQFLNYSHHQVVNSRVLSLYVQYFINEYIQLHLTII